MSKLFRYAYAILLLIIGIYWLYSLPPFSWAEYIPSFSASKAESQKSVFYGFICSTAIIFYGIFEIVNVYKKSK